jgi:hypothetical protein
MKRYQECPFCGRKFVVGYFEHYAECARAAQRELDREHAKKVKKKSSEKLEEIFKNQVA